MNNYCRNCGKKLDSEVDACNYCKTKIIVERLNETEIKELEEKLNSEAAIKEEEDKYYYLIITLYVLGFLVGAYANGISTLKFVYPLLFVGATILLVYAKIKVPKGKRIKNLFITVIFIFLVILLSLIFVIETCKKIGIL